MTIAIQYVHMGAFTYLCLKKLIHMWVPFLVFMWSGKTEFWDCYAEMFSGISLDKMSIWSIAIFLTVFLSCFCVCLWTKLFILPGYMNTRQNVINVANWCWNSISIVNHGFFVFSTVHTQGSFLCLFNHQWGNWWCQYSWQKMNLKKSKVRMELVRTPYVWNLKSVQRRWFYINFSIDIFENSC